MEFLDWGRGYGRTLAWSPTVVNGVVARIFWRRAVAMHVGRGAGAVDDYRQACR